MVHFIFRLPDKLALLWSTWMVDRWQISYGFRGVCQKQFCLVVCKLLHCATFIGTVTDMSPERIRNESYSYAADIWSLCLALFECGTGEFPYSTIDGPINLMLQILDDPSPSPSKEKFSPEFCSFIDACLQKLLPHPFIQEYKNSQVDLAAFVRSVCDPVQRLKDLADTPLCRITWRLLLVVDKATELSLGVFLVNNLLGGNDIFSTLSDVRRKLRGDWPLEQLVHVVEKLQCHAHVVRWHCNPCNRIFYCWSQFIICGDGVQVEGMPNFRDCSVDIVRGWEHSRSSSLLNQEMPLDATMLLIRSFVSCLILTRVLTYA